MDEVGNAERSDDDVGCIADDENEQYRYDPRCPYRHAVRRGHVDAADISQDVVLVGNEGTKPRKQDCGMDRKAARPGVYFVSGRESRGLGAGRGGAGSKGKERVGVRSGRSWLSEIRNFFHPRQSRREWLVIALYSFRSASQHATIGTLLMPRYADRMQ